MAVSRRRTHSAYGIGQPLYDLSPLPMKSTRAPTTADLAEIGTPWIRTSTKQTWILTAIASNSATWTPTSVNAGATINTGSLVLTTGNIVVTAGDITATAGSLVCGGGLLVNAGGGTITAGGLTVTAGGITATTGDINAAAGDLGAQTLYIGGDSGTGGSTTTAFTNVVDAVLSSGAGTVLMKTANPGNSAGFIKIYLGSTTAWIPYWTNISP